MLDSNIRALIAKDVDPKSELQMPSDVQKIIVDEHTRFDPKIFNDPDTTYLFTFNNFGKDNGPHLIYDQRMGYLKNVVEFCHDHGNYIYIDGDWGVDKLITSMTLLSSQEKPRITRRFNELLHGKKEEFKPVWQKIETQQCTPEDIVEFDEFNQGISSKFANELKKHYKDIVINDRVIDSDYLLHLGNDAREALLLDLKFYQLFKHQLPIENLCSQLATYKAIDKQQKGWQADIQRVLEDVDLHRPTGLWLEGSAGKGKTHLSIAVAKNLLSKGVAPVFITEQMLKLNPNFIKEAIEKNKGKRVAWVFDDINQQHSDYAKKFVGLFKEAFQRNDIFITSSNNPLKTIISGALVTDPETRERMTRRANEIFGLETRSEEKHLQEIGILRQSRKGQTNEQLISNVTELNQDLSSFMLASMPRYYPGLEIDTVSKKINPNSLIELGNENVKALIKDLNYYHQAGIHTPSEDMFCQLETYFPTTDIQKKFKSKTEAFIKQAIEGNQSGLFLGGVAGIGKTHLSIAATKELMENGITPIFINPERLQHETIADIVENNNISGKRVWVLDDINNPFDNQTIIPLTTLIEKVQSTGDSIIVSSNTDLDIILSGAYVTAANKDEKIEKAKDVLGIRSSNQDISAAA